MTLFTLLALCSTVQAAQPANLLPNPGFEQGLEGWDSSGNASFDVDREVRHEGRQSLRITVPPDAPLHYQRAAWEMPVKPGDLLTASFWIRCKGLTGGAGAYGAMEFYQGDQRVDCVESQLTRAEIWQPMQFEATAPNTADRMRLVLICHAHGTAWFDGVELTRPEPQPMGVRFTLQPRGIITDNWLGFGVQGDLFLERKRVAADVTAEDRQLIRRRVLEMRPQIARLYFRVNNWEPEKAGRTPDSEAMLDLRATLALYKESGTDVHITEWGQHLPAWLEPVGSAPSPAHRQAYTDSFVAAIVYLREQCGFDNIRYANVWNEPNGRVPWDDYAATCRCLATSIKNAGLAGKVALLAPDETGTFDWTARSAAELDDVIDYYDVHNYSSNTASNFGYWVGSRIAIMPPATRSRSRPARKRLMVTEFGMQDGMSTFESKRNGDYDYGLFLAGCAIEAASKGASAALMWCLMDTYYDSYHMKWGLWRYKDEDWEPRPGYYAWSLINRYTQRGSTVHPIKSNVTDAAAVAFRSPGRRAWTLLTVNRRAEPRPFAIAQLPPDSLWEPFVYSMHSVPTADRGMIRAGGIRRAGPDGELKGNMPAKSFILWRQVRR